VIRMGLHHFNHVSVTSAYAVTRQMQSHCH
jgi:hypothetical protein